VVRDHLDGNRKLVARHTVVAHNGLRFPLQPGEDFTIEIAVQCLFCNPDYWRRGLLPVAS
jgi:hypothetical protein